MTPKRPRLADADPATLIRDGRLPERTVQVCLAADLVGEWEALDRQRAEVERGDSMVDPAAAIKVAMDNLSHEMDAATVTFRLRALSRRQWRELYAAHPPRKNPDGSTLQRDVVLGVHYENFFDALLKASIVDPKLDDETLELLLGEKLTDRQWEGLTDVAWNLNRAPVSVPFLPGGSPNHKTSSTT